MRIAISPDENPGDPGAVDNGIVERDVNIKVATALEAALKRSGQDAWFDPSITFTQRVVKANADGTQVLVACAHNAAGNPAAEGALFIFCGPDAHTFGHQQAAADNIGRLLVSGGLVGRYVTYNEEVVECCDFNGDSVYVEFGYETNPTDAATIKQPDYPTRAAELVAQGLAQTYGFAYAPPVQPNVTPEWKTNLVQLPAPLSGKLASAVDVVNTVTNAVVEQLAAGAGLTVTHSTKAHGNEYYMTQWSVDHATGYGVLKSAVTLEPVPLPLPVYAALGGTEKAAIASDTDIAKVRIAALAWLEANRGETAEITKDGAAFASLEAIPPDPLPAPGPDPAPAPAPKPAPAPAPAPAPLPVPPEPLTGFAAFEQAITDFADRELIQVLELVVKEFGRRKP